MTAVKSTAAGAWLSRSAALRLAISAGAAAAALAALAAVVGPERTYNPLDRVTHSALLVPRGGAAWNVAAAISWCASTPVVLFLGVVMAALAILVRRSLTLAAWCIATPALAAVLEVVIKHIVGRVMPGSPRPHPVRPVVALVHPAYSFPSGHVVGITSVAIVAVGLVWLATDRALPRAVAAAGAMLAVLGVAAARIMVRAHLATDDIGGFLLALATALALAAAFGWAGRRGALQ